MTEPQLDNEFIMKTDEGYLRAFDDSDVSDDVDNIQQFIADRPFIFTNTNVTREEAMKVILTDNFLTLPLIKETNFNINGFSFEESSRFTP